MTAPSNIVSLDVCPQKRKQEFGVLHPKELGTIDLMFENLPVWLLCLCNVKVKKIYIPQENSFSFLSKSIKDKTIDTPWFDKVITYIGRRLFCFE